MRPRALVYGDVDLNLIDGSAIWAQAMVQALAKAGCEVTLLLKAPVRTGRLVDPLTALPGVTVRRPHEEGLTTATGPLDVRQAAELLEELDRPTPYDLIVVRGRRLAARLAGSVFAGRMWTYLTDVPQSLAALDPAYGTPSPRGTVGELRRIARASRLLLCQTEELRCFLESLVPAACGRCVLFPPVVVLPEQALDESAATAPERPHPVARERPLRLVYTGKFAPHWNTYEMTSLPRMLRARGVNAELHMIGDKIHEVRSDPKFARRMRVALESTPGVIWHGGHPRAEAMRLAAGCDIGLSWRDPELDASLELSTKVLEMGALGVPVVLNRTPMHETLLGVDYPLFVNSVEGNDPRDVVDVIATAAAEPDVFRQARDRCREAAQDFTLDAAAARLTRYLERAFPGHRIGGVGRDAVPDLTPSPGTAADRSARRPLRVGVAGHDLKFCTRLIDHLQALPDIDVRVDHWPALSRHDAARSQELIDWADVILCEWCGPNAVWYARRKRPDQRLLVRLHRFELYGPWPRQLDIGAVDQVICVSPHYAQQTREITGWPEDKITVVPNWVDAAQLDRPKLPGAQYHLGMIGIAPSRKRLDLAVDVLEELRLRDPRFTLFVKSKLPWEYWWIWKRQEERRYFEALFRRIRRSPLLGDAVVFDPYGPDVPAWLRRIGFVLSTSDDESFHLAPAEGMGSGAVPALLNWPGADTIYDTRWIHRDPMEIADAIADTVATGRWETERALARDQLRRAYALDRVCAMWTRVLAGRPATEAGENAMALPAAMH